MGVHMRQHSRSTFFWKPIFSLLVLVMPMGIATAETEVTPEDGLPERQQPWDDTMATGGQPDPEQLSEQTRLVKEAVQSGISLDSGLWDQTRELLDKWESSSALDRAREAYFSILTHLCERLGETGEPFAGESALRAYLQRAMSLTQSPLDEGRFLLYLAESWLRSSDGKASLLRRVESLLQQAAGILPDEPPMDAVHARLGGLYARLGAENGETGLVAKSDGSRLTRAVRHFQSLLEMSGSRQRYRNKAEEALAWLLEPELEIQVSHRFLPQDDIRFMVRTRNLAEVEVKLAGLPAGEETSTHPIGELRSMLTGTETNPERMRLAKRIDVGGRHVNDWRQRRVRLGGNLAAGWYGIHVEGAGLERHSLLLVTPLEVAAFPRVNGDLLVWVVDSETGLPVANAIASLIDAEGKILTSVTTDLEGKVLVRSARAAGWVEIDVVAGPNPGHLRRTDLPETAPQVPWLVTHPARLPPGGILQWSLLDPRPGQKEGVQSVVSFLLPDGNRMSSEAEATGSGWAVGTLEVPGGTGASGPIYALVPGGGWLLAGHLRLRETLPLEIEFSGDVLDRRRNLFLASTPVGIRITPTFGINRALPDFIRLRALALERPPLVPSGDGLPRMERRTVFERILPFRDIDQGGLYFELPEVPMEGALVPLELEVLSLSGPEPLARAFLGLAPYRDSIRFEVEERIIRPEDTVAVRFERVPLSEPATRPVEGELVVYRETWESRYIHRKRGTPLTEAEYLELPDRSLLGAAKTDYRLVEEGFIREEVRRIRIESDETEGTLPVRFQRPGYYNLEFEGQEADSTGLYPEGPLEVWVVPESPDLRAFRSDKPRLVMETEADGRVELLILLDRLGSSVLTELVRQDGTTLTRVQQPPEAALFLDIDESGMAPLAACRVMVVSERRTDRLWRKAEGRKERPGWELEADSYFGLNPGVSFKWPLVPATEDQPRPALWTFFTRGLDLLDTGWLHWQRQVHRSGLPPEAARMVSLSAWLPLANPFDPGSSESGHTVEPLRQQLRDPAKFLALYPEVERFTGPAPSARPFKPVLTGAEENRLFIEGRFPETAGSWDLKLFGTDDRGGLQVRSWLVSTELPIRSLLEGPSTLRQGDETGLQLSLENTTNGSALLSLETRLPEILEFASRPTERIRLAPSHRTELDVAVRALQPGRGPVKVRALGGESSSEAVHELTVLTDPPRPVFRFSLADPQASPGEYRFDTTGWERVSLMVASGLGAFLPEIRSKMKTGNEFEDPLMAVLGDWALWRVLEHHGSFQTGAGPDHAEDLAALLGEREAESGGWGWMRGSNADPWLSALVLWSLELFTDSGSLEFQAFRERGRLYLESVLADESVDRESRLFALRALAVPAFRQPEIRPSRIQALSFLEFLRQQAEFESVEVALLLQVAKAYRFQEEVHLLTAELQRRAGQAAAMAGGLHEASLVFLALDSLEKAGPLRRELLRNSLRALAREGGRPSWYRLSGFLNLVAEYYWKGDFNIDGMVEISIGGGAPQTLVLNPEEGGTGLLQFPPESLPEAGEAVSLSLDMSSALSPVFLACIGKTRTDPDPPPAANSQTGFFHEHYTETLLKGARQRVTALDGDTSGIRPGQSIRMVLSLEMPEASPFAVFAFPVPAGLDLQADAIEHLLKAAGNNGRGGPAEIRQSVRSGQGGLTTLLLFEPLPAGTHQFSLEHKVAWPGSYVWPAPMLFFPKTGGRLRLNEPFQLEILPPGGTGEGP